MYYVAESNIKHGTNRRMHRTDGVFPTSTMQLHQRIIGWHRKRRIPVRDADNASNLNAYLIDPKYLENGEAVMPKSDEQVLPKPSIPVYQYSKITHDVPEKANPAETSSRRNMIAAGLTAFGAEVSERFHSLVNYRPVTRYFAGSGALPWWKQRLRIFGATLVTGGLIVAAATIGTGTTAKPTPVNANPNAAQLETARNNQADAPPTETTATPKNATPSNDNQFVAPQQQATVAPHTSSQFSATTPLGTSNQTTQSTSTASSQTTSTGTGNTTTQTANPASTAPSTQPTVLSPVIDPVTTIVNGVLQTKVSVNTTAGL